MPIKKSSKKTMTEMFLSQWGNDLSVFDSGTKKTVSSPPHLFLDFPDNVEAQQFFKGTIRDFFLKHEDYLSDTDKDERARLVVFFLIQIARFLAPKDNNEFLLKVLLPLERNPLFANLIGNVVHITSHRIEDGFLNIPSTGLFVAPNPINKYTFACPKSPKEVYIIYIGDDPSHEYTDDELIDFSYGTPPHGIILHDFNKLSTTALKNKQKSNLREIGDLCSQLKDPGPIIDLVKAVIHGIPGIKNSLLLKSLDIGIRFWNK